MPVILDDMTKSLYYFYEIFLSCLVILDAFSTKNQKILWNIRNLFILILEQKKKSAFLGASCSDISGGNFLMFSPINMWF
jgi:hypothetical protein